MPFKCDVHGWMNAYVGVLDHPYFAVTTGGGRVRAQEPAARHLHDRSVARAARHADAAGDARREGIERRELHFQAGRPVKSNANAAVAHASPHPHRRLHHAGQAAAEPARRRLGAGRLRDGRRRDLRRSSGLLATILGTALVAGGASAYNQLLERKTDALMQRTRLRPLPDGRLQTGEALVFATALSALGLATLAAGVNTLSAMVALRHAPQLRGDLHAAQAA